MKIELTIDELVLHGFTPSDCYRIGSAVERELTRLLAEQGVPPSLTYSGALAHLDGGAFNMAPASKSETVGAQVAQAVYGGLRR